MVVGAGREEPMRRLAITFTAIALVAAACGDDGAGGILTATTSTTAPGVTTTAAPATTTTGAVATTTEAPATTATTAEPVTTAPAGSRCTGLPGMTIPASAADLIRWPGSFDGDPQPERIQDSDGAILFEDAGSYWFGFSLHIDYVVFIELPEPLSPTFEPTIVAVRDFGDADDGVLVHIDRSLASGADVYRFYFLDGACQVEDAGIAGEDPLDFIVGFGAAHREGFSCTNDGVWETTAGDQGGGVWERLDTFYEWDPTGTGFVVGPTDGFEAPAGDPDIQSAGDLDC
jgi:hypothetical protein